MDSPPMGAANVHATPTAHAAASISLVRDSFYNNTCLLQTEGFNLPLETDINTFTCNVH